MADGGDPRRPDRPDQEGWLDGAAEPGGRRSGPSRRWRFWLVAGGLTMLGAGLAFTVPGGPTGWAWSRAHHSVDTLVSLSAHWGWEKPRNLPFTAAVESAIRPMPRWAPPTLAVLGVLLAALVAARRWVALFLAGADAVLVFLAVTGSGGADAALLYLPVGWGSQVLPTCLAVTAVLVLGFAFRLVWRVRGRRRRRRSTPAWARPPGREPAVAWRRRWSVALDLAVLRCRGLPRGARVRFLRGKLLRLPLILAGRRVTLPVGAGALRVSTAGDLGALQSALVDVHDSLVVPGILTSTDAPVVVDVGASIGQFAAATKLAYPGSRIVCLEPDPDTFGALRRHASSLRNVTVLRCAAGRESATATLFRHRHPAMSTLIRPARRTYDPADTEQVRIVRLDDLLTDLPRIDLLKIDVEGAELDVLCGATAVLRRTRYLLVELGLGRDAGGTNLDLLRFVKQHAPDARIVRFGRPLGSTTDPSCQDVVIALFPTSAVRVTPPTPGQQQSWWPGPAQNRSRTVRS